MFKIVLSMLANMKKAFLLLAFFGSSVAFAEPENWALGLGEPVSEVASELKWFHNDVLLPLSIAVCVLVLGLLIFVCIKFSEKNNRVPSQTTHHSLLEVAWTLVPVIVLGLVFIPSIRLLYFSDEQGDIDMTIKVTGHQWYWSYEYQDHDNLSFDSYIKEKEDIEEDQKHLYRLLVDNALVVPVNTRIKVLLTASDVLHNWSVQSFGVRLDAVPGRLNETWFEATKIGKYYGFCSELCGQGHAFMPVEVHVVEKDVFEEWLVGAKQEFAQYPLENNKLDDRIKVAENSSVNKNTQIFSE